jgi:hypothetical protein
LYKTYIFLLTFAAVDGKADGEPEKEAGGAAEKTLR